MKRTHFHLLVLLLLAGGLLTFLYKVFVLQLPLLPAKNPLLWGIETRVSFNAKGRSAKVSLFIPKNSPRALILDENFISPGYGRTDGVSAPNRLTEWSVRRATGQQTLYYRAIVRTGEDPEKSPIPPEKRPELLEINLTGALQAAAQVVLDRATTRSTDADELTRELFKELTSTSPDQTLKLLLGRHPTADKIASVGVELLAMANIPARVVHGVELIGQPREVPLLHWIEIYSDELKSWKNFDVSTFSFHVPETYFPWYRGVEDVATVTGGTGLSVRFYESPQEEESLLAAAFAGAAGNPLYDYSLFTLPIQTQAVYRILLIIPIGAFVVAFLRNVIGMKTFGTFMPVLVGIAFRETGLIAGVLLFVLIVSLGLSARFYLERLKLLMVPRLAAVLTIVVLMMAALSIILHKLGIDRGLSLALFPMVILTMTIERMSVIWEEQGAGEAISQGMGSLLAAMICFLLIRMEQLQFVVFAFPELLFVVLALILLLGRYTGYRLFELIRFKDFGRNAAN